jgi:hypothetical protein
MTGGGELLTLREVAAETRHAVGSVRRWVADGVIGPGGRRVKLPARKVGGRVLVGRADLAAFLDALNADRPAAALPPTEAERRRSLAAGLAEWDAILGRTLR